MQVGRPFSRCRHRDLDVPGRVRIRDLSDGQPVVLRHHRQVVGRVGVPNVTRRRFQLEVHRDLPRCHVHWCHRHPGHAEPLGPGPQHLGVGELEGEQAVGPGVEQADEVIVGVGDVHVSVQQGDVVGFAEGGVPAWAVVRTRQPRAHQGVDRAQLQVDQFDLVVVGVGHQHHALVVGHSQGVLEPGQGQLAVHIAELEQALADEGPDLVVLHHPDGRHLRVCEEDAGPVGVDARGLGQGRPFPGPVPYVLPARASVPLGLVGPEVHTPQLVGTRHGYVQVVAQDGKVPRRVQCQVGALALGGVAPLVALAKDRLDGLGLHVHLADEVVAGVGHVEGVATGVVGHPLGCVELGVLERAVGRSDRTRADDIGYLTFWSEDDDPVVIGVGDEETLALPVHLDLARIAEGASGDSIANQVDREGREVDGTLEGLREGRYRIVEHGEGALPRVLDGHVASRVDEHEAGPGADAVG